MTRLRIRGRHITCLRSDSIHRWRARLSIYFVRNLVKTVRNKQLMNDNVVFLIFLESWEISFFENHEKKQKNRENSVKIMKEIESRESWIIFILRPNGEEDRKWVDFVDNHGWYRLCCGIRFDSDFRWYCLAFLRLREYLIGILLVNCCRLWTYIYHDKNHYYL